MANNPMRSSHQNAQNMNIRISNNRVCYSTESDKDMDKISTDQHSLDLFKQRHINDSVRSFLCLSPYRHGGEWCLNAEMYNGWEFYIQFIRLKANEHDLDTVLDDQRRELTAAKNLESDLNFAYNLQLQEAITASLSTTTTNAAAATQSTPSPPRRDRSLAAFFPDDL
ncbi:hypothetical protein ACFE04_023976 [Oxalis oulophora]